MITHVTHDREVSMGGTKLAVSLSLHVYLQIATGTSADQLAQQATAVRPNVEPTLRLGRVLVWLCCIRRWCSAFGGDGVTVNVTFGTQHHTQNVLISLQGTRQPTPHGRKQQTSTQCWFNAEPASRRWPSIKPALG